MQREAAGFVPHVVPSVFSAARLCAAQVLVISQCNVMLPDAVRKMPKLERLVRCQLPLLCG